MPANSRERRRADGAPLSSTQQLGLCASVYNADNVPLPLSPSLNTCTRSTTPPPHPPSTAPSLLPQAVQSSETHTHTHTQQEGCKTGPSAPLRFGYQGVLAASPFISHQRALACCLSHSTLSLYPNIAESETYFTGKGRRARAISMKGTVLV